MSSANQVGALFEPVAFTEFEQGHPSIESRHVSVVVPNRNFGDRFAVTGSRTMDTLMSLYNNDHESRGSHV